MSYGVPAESPASQAPVCPRHPDRISYIRCQRCGRAACPECQHPAPVGIQCVDCFRRAGAQAPRYRTAVGGKVREGRPVVTYTLMALCAAAYLLQWVVPGFTERFWYRPLLTGFEPWTVLTSAFLHSTGSVLHIAFNLYALWFLGRAMEPMLGRSRFIALYLISALGGSLGVLLLGNPLAPVLGASGAIFGLFGALLILQRRQGGDIRGIVVLLAINLALGFFYPNISWQAHVGGLVTGLACALVLGYAPRGRHRTLVQCLGLAGITAVILVGGLIRVDALYGALAGLG